MSMKSSRETSHPERELVRKTLEPRPPWSEAARAVRSLPVHDRTKGQGSQRGGARHNPERRGSSRGGGSRGR
jgi:hypothetical protein